LTATVPDFNDISDWAINETAFAIHNEMIKPDTIENIRPRVNAKRDEVAMALLKLIKYLKL